jgi:hypothetical protein
MDHETAVREMLTERYLLQELNPAEQDAFEEHFFECRECGDDVRAGSTFITFSQSELTEGPQLARGVSAKKSTHDPWWGWLRPAFTAPALAALLAVIVYQNVIYPRTRARLTQAQVLPWASVVVGARSGEKPSITVSRDKGFLLFVRIPTDGTFARYTADLYNPGGKLESSLAIPAAAGQDEWPVLVPAANRVTGQYRMLVRGFTSAGEGQEIGSTSFELEVRQ